MDKETKMYQTDAPYTQNTYSEQPQNWQKNQKNSLEFSEKFKTGKKWNDVWAMVLFILSFLAFTIISGISINGYMKTDQYKQHKFLGPSSSFTINANTVFLFIFIVGSAFTLSFIYFLLARMFTKQFIWMTGILYIMLGIFISLYYIIRGLYVIAILFVVFVLVYAYCFYTWRNRIPLATMYLKFTMDVSKAYPSVYFVSFCGTIFSIGFLAWFFLTFITSYMLFSRHGIDGQENLLCREDPLACQSKYLGLIMFFLFFNAYWITEVIKNVIHTTICGVYGAYYYGFNTLEGISKHATVSSFRRSMTYSFGSICFGSLIASFVQILRDFFRSLVHDRYSANDIFGTIISYFASCIVMLLDWLVQYFNHYCYAQIALYGKKYFTAARETWRLFKANGIDALINDCLIDNVLSFGAFFVAAISAFFCYIYMRFTTPEYNNDGKYYIGIILISFFISLQICNTVIIAIRSGVATLFVGISEDREVLRRNFPLLYNQMFGTV